MRLEFQVLLWVTVLLFLGITIGAQLHTLDSLKVLSIKHDSMILYAPLYGINFSLSQLWDATILSIYLSFMGICLVSSYIGFLINDLKKGK